MSKDNPWWQTAIEFPCVWAGVLAYYLIGLPIASFFCGWVIARDQVMKGK